MLFPAISRAAGAVTLIIATLVLAPMASAAATLTAPANGSTVTTTRPTFTWVPAAGETTEYLQVSSQPVVDSNGRLSGTSAMYQSTAAATYTDDRDLFAGPYWWQVETSSPGQYGKVRQVSAVSSFTIAPRIDKPAISFVRYRYINEISMTIRWKGNVKAGKVAVVVRKGAKVFKRLSDVEQYGSVTSPNSSYLNFKTGRLKEGTKLTVTTTITGGGAKRVVTKTVLSA